ncbi:MAG: hypothetical protein R6W91_07255 [Thermoplasmata archaeon]
MAQEEDEAPKESTEDAQSLVVTRFRTHHMGVWGNTVSSLAPVTGMITNGYSEGNGDVRGPVMNNWSDDP